MIKKNEKILVPEGIRYLSDWEGFNLDNFPKKCIIDKQLPGCGFTEYCITSPLNIILASPRKKLIKNKYDQHKGEVYLVDVKQEEDLNVDKDLDEINKKRSKSKSISSDEENVESEQKNTPDLLKGKSFLERLNIILDQNGLLPEEEKNTYVRIYKEIENYINKMNMYNRPYKILVTYDSYRLVKEILTRLGVFESFYSVVDEFQSILHDSRFKSSTEISFLEYLKQSPTAYFVSATPMLDDYINMLNEFDGLPYFELDWGTLDPGRIVKPNLKVLTMKSVGSKAKEVIQSYINKNFEKIVVQNEDGSFREVISDEAVLFMNSVNHIISIIKKMELDVDQVTILCSDTRENRRKIEKKLGKKYLQCLSDIPLKGVKPKMFTFCTRTTYLGADFYSTCARTFIFSDSNLDSLAVDISDDLPQILGRQRLNENPWKNSATFYYRYTADYKSLTEEDFLKKIEEKKENTNSLLRSYGNVEKDFDKDNLADVFRDLAKALNYKKNYVAVNEYYTPETGVNIIPVFNNLVLVNELRAFRIAQIDYKDRFTVFAKLKEKFGGGILNRPDENLIYEFLEKYELSTMKEKYKMLCESDLPKDTIEYILSQLQDSDVVKSEFLLLGPEKLIGLCYNRTLIDIELEKVKVNLNNELVSEIFNKFSINELIPSPIIKSIISSIYNDLNYKGAPKAVDIKNYFEVRETLVRRDLDGSGKTKAVKAYELLRPKEQYQELYNKIKGIQ